MPKSCATFAQEQDFLKQHVPDAFPPVPRETDVGTIYRNDGADPERLRARARVGDAISVLVNRPEAYETRIEPDNVGAVYVTPDVLPYVVQDDGEWVHQAHIREGLETFPETSFKVIPFESLSFDPTSLDVEGTRQHLNEALEWYGRTVGNGSANAASLSAKLGTDAYGSYLPWHYFAESPKTPWGIYLFLENIIDLSHWLYDESPHPKPDRATCLALAWNVTYRHELFHYHVERYSIKAEILKRSRVYLKYDNYVIGQAPLQNVEEALAQAVVLESVLISKRTGLSKYVWSHVVKKIFSQFPNPYGLFQCHSWNGPDHAHALLAGRVVEGSLQAGEYPGLVLPKLEYASSDRFVPGYLLAQPSIISRFQLQTPKRRPVEAFLNSIGARRDPHGVGDHEVWILPALGNAKFTLNYTRHNREADLASMKSLAKVLQVTVYDLVRAILGRHDLSNLGQKVLA